MNYYLANLNTQINPAQEYLAEIKQEITVLLSMSLGKLYLIPVPLAEEAADASFTHFHYELINQLDEYVVENEKTARKFLKQSGLKRPQSELIIHDYGKHIRSKDHKVDYLSAALKGKDIGLMSEAGCPGVADPGADIVADAHKKGIQVIPLVGPSSILLALMASGFNGQRFAFHGYLPIDKAERTRKVKELEAISLKDKQTQIFIETPFRNNQLLAELIRSCKPQTKICVASNLTSKEEFILSLPASKWKNKEIDLHKKPTIFLLFA